MKLGRPGYNHGKGAIALGFDGNIVLAEGTTVPTDAATGYAPGCIFFKRAGAAATSFYRNVGTAASCNFDALSLADLDLSLLTASVTELNYLDADLASNVLTQGTGVDGAEGPYVGSIRRDGALIITSIYANIDDLVGSATDLDIIGESTTANCHWGQITTAKSGTIIGGRVTCLEVPTGGTADIDFYSSNIATGTQDTIITDAALGTETALVTSGGAWTLSAPTKAMSGLPTANDYIYIVNGAASGGTFTAGKFLIELIGV